MIPPRDLLRLRVQILTRWLAAASETDSLLRRERVRRAHHQIDRIDRLEQQYFALYPHPSRSRKLHGDSL